MRTQLARFWVNDLKFLLDPECEHVIARDYTSSNAVRSALAFLGASSAIPAYQSRAVRHLHDRIVSDLGNDGSALLVFRWLFLALAEFDPAQETHIITQLAGSGSMEASTMMRHMKTASQPGDLVRNEQNILEQVVAHPFVAGMSAHHLEMLAHYATQKEFNTGEVIFRAGEPAHGFYLVESGRIALEGWVMEHGPIVTDIVHAGEPLGWSWLFPPYRWHFDARVTEPTTVIFFDGDILRQHYNEDLTLAHELSQRMCKVMVHRLQAARRKLVEVRGNRA